MARTAKGAVKMLHWRHPLAAFVRDRIVIQLGFNTLVPRKQRELYAYEASRG
jgi:hypothetical protein